jgi:protein tyrosine/serine phosphatase
MTSVQRLFAVAALNLVLILWCVVLGAQTPIGSLQAPKQGTVEPGGQTLQPRGPESRGPVPNFGIIWPGKLTRSGMPKNEDGWKWLRKQGVKSIVNFRARNDVNYQGYGFGNSLWIPMDNGRLPTEVETLSYLTWIQDPVNQPVNVQCAEGKDRTGMMAALARYAIEGWSMDGAVNEASLYRKGKRLADERINWLRDWARKHPPAGQRRQ